jgi:hypothetical protein
VLGEGMWEAVIGFEHWYDYNNADGIHFEIGKYSESTYTFTVTSLSPVGHWEFDDCSDPGKDSSGYNNDATLIGNPECTGCAMRFDGIDDYLDVPDDPSLDMTTKLTVALWMQQPVLATDKALAAKWDYKTQGCWALQTDNSDSDELRVFTATSLSDNGSGGNAKTANANMVAGNWYHVAFVYDGDGATNADRLKVYVDGVEKTLSFAGTIPSSLQNSSASVKIGKFGGILGRYFKGVMDDVRIYNRALSTQEVGGLASISPCYPPVANAGPDQTVEDTDDNGFEWIDLDGSQSTDPDGTIVSYVWTEDGNQIAMGVNPTVELSVGTHIITLTVTDDDGATDTDTVIITVTGLVVHLEEIMSFDGIDDYLDMTTKLTVALLMEQPVLATNKALAAKWDYRSQGCWAFQTDYFNPDELMVFTATRLGDNGSGGNARTTDVDMVAGNQYRVAFVYDGDGATNADRLKVYVDCEEKTLSFAGTIPSVLQNSSCSVKIGKFGGILGRYFNGAMDDVRIYNRALSAEEIRALCPLRPIANAGQDQTVPDADGNCVEQICLDGSQSTHPDPNRTIASYVWTEDGNQICMNVSCCVDLPVGEHEITLTVTDDIGLTDTDTVTITVTGTDLVGHWKFDNCSNSGRDSSCHNNTATLIGNPECTIEGMSFDGVDAYLDIPDDPSDPSLDMTTKLTVALLMEQPVLATNKALAAKWDYRSQGCWAFQTDNFNPDELRVFIATRLGDNGSGGNARTTNVDMVAGNQYHVAFVYDGDGATNADRLRIYVNGRQKTLSFAGTIPSSLQDSLCSVKIGKFGGILGRYFNGAMDDVRIYDRALTVEEIRELVPPDYEPPAPNPMTWAIAPHATGSSSISMTATMASDTSEVEYYFDETSGNPGGSDSGWQDDRTYQDGGLSASTTYTYRVMARDKSTNQNETGWSSSLTAATHHKSPVGTWNGTWYNDVSDSFTLNFYSNNSLSGSFRQPLEPYGTVTIPVSGTYSFNGASGYLTFECAGSITVQGYPIAYYIDATGYGVGDNASGDYWVTTYIYANGSWQLVDDNVHGTWVASRIGPP